MPISETLKIIFVPIFGLIALIIGAISLREGLSFKNVATIIVGIVLMGFSINDGLNTYSDKGNYIANAPQ